MKRIRPIEPFVLCERVELQDKIKELFIPGQEDKNSPMRRVVFLSQSAHGKGVKTGDIVVTRQNKYLELPIYLTEDDQVPYQLEDTDKLEIIDPSQIIAIYREEKEEEEEDGTDS